MSKKKNETIYVSGKLLAAHDFRKLLRAMVKSGHDPIVLFEKLQHQKAIITKSMSALLGIVAVLHFAAPMNSAGLSISTPYLNVEIPKLMVSFIMSFCWCFGVLTYLSYTIIDGYSSQIKSTLFRKAPWPLMDRFYDGAAAWVDPTTVKWNFFKTGRVHAFITNLSLIVIAIPFILFGWLILKSSFNFLLPGIASGSFSGNDLLIAISAAILFTYPVLYSIILLLPFPIKRNRKFVRWNFLTPLWRSEHKFHPSTNTWLERQKSE